MRRLLALALVLAACGGTADEPEETLPATTTSVTASSSTTATSVATTATTTAPAPPTTQAAPTTTATAPRPTTAVTVAPGPTNRLLAAGDIASCALRGDERTASLLDGLGGTVAPLGDLAYESGTAAEFRDCYHPTWGRHRDRTRPAPGNHDYRSADGAAYYDYFGSAAGDPGKGWYAYDLAGWQVIVLNSNCGSVGCGNGSEQANWLAGELATNSAECTVAYWHHPRFSSGKHGGTTAVDTFWRVLAGGGADVVMGGHDHDYERFGHIDGIRSFVVGTGGASLRSFGSTAPGSEVRISGAHGVLVLTLAEGSYEWQFVDVDGNVRDSGADSCR